MTAHTVEYRKLQTLDPDLVIQEILDDLYQDQPQGGILVVIAAPFASLQIARRRWIQLIRLVQDIRFVTFQAHRIQELSSQLNYMQRLRFVLDAPQSTEGCMHFVSAEAALQIHHLYSAIYIVGPLPHSATQHLERQIAAHGYFVRYGTEEPLPSKNDYAM